MTDKIDFVVLWVDPNDKKWQEERKKYAEKLQKSDGIDNDASRYRDWDNFNYWFRGVEKFAPWVNKVHLVTNGQIPKWLNKDCPKLNIVNHSDIMPKETLPTFNSNAIEMFLHKIPGLSEQFVAFNDDMFITKKVKPTDFFKNGKPVNSMALFAIRPVDVGQSRYRIIAKNTAIINKHFNFNKVKKQNLGKFLSLKQGPWIAFTYPLMLYKHFVGFRNFHIGVSYLKSTFEKVWEIEPDVLQATANNRFRDSSEDINHWLFNYWQFATGNFYQRRASFGASKNIDDPKIPKLIEKQKYHILCLNDPEKPDLDSSTEEIIKCRVNQSFDKILKEKSKFEL